MKLLKAIKSKLTGGSCGGSTSGISSSNKNNNNGRAQSSINSKSKKTGHFELSATAPSGDETSLDNSKGSVSPNSSADNCDDAFANNHGYVHKDTKPKKNRFRGLKKLLGRRKERKNASSSSSSPKQQNISNKKKQPKKPEETKPLHEMMDSPIDDQQASSAATIFDHHHHQAAETHEQSQDHVRTWQQRVNENDFETSTTSSDNDIDSLALLSTVYRDGEDSRSHSHNEDDDDHYYNDGDSRIYDSASYDSVDFEQQSFEITMTCRSDLFDDTSEMYL
eukprot:CAMPEP_0119567744 /NCGR_PEP_ID=MMETSP1352-20130426/36847_1 /TAXON_ID=265584 /ORGANISM="Stauroneis constricta, Strain CCMP1120" /LENGTH=278 /DNA_ID=CAMNT_0007617033 /DNA_START=1 /DNA_END=834 /DNA_ORIENTATION=+